MILVGLILYLTIAKIKYLENIIVSIANRNKRIRKKLSLANPKLRNKALPLNIQFHENQKNILNPFLLNNCFLLSL